MKNLLSKKAILAVSALSLLSVSSAYATVIDSAVMTAEMNAIKADITTIAGYGIGLILTIAAVTIVYSLIKRSR